MSRCRQNYHAECEAGVNTQITREYEAMYAYTALAAYYDRDDVAFTKVAAFFKKCAAEEKEHAEKFIEFQNKRGGRVTFSAIKPSSKTEFASLVEAYDFALELERSVNDSLLALHKVAAGHDDGHMTDFIEGQFLGEQVDAIKELSSHVTNLKRLGPGQGEWHFNESL